MARKKKQKQDEAHDETDRIIEETERKIHTEYAKAEKELKKKVDAFFQKFEAEDEAKRQQLAKGEITADYYKKWRTTRMATGQRWEDMRQIIAEDMANANNLARSTINGHAADVYALNRNFATYQVEKEARINTSFTLYNRRAVERLMVNDERLLPLPTEGSRAWQAMMNKDLRWNQQKINSSLIQGILQGDSIPEISDRLLNIVGMNEVSARRSARTMMTSVENKARDDSYEELKSKGVELETIWLATLDDRTRHSHRQLHGEVRGEDGKYSNGLRYPADPAGAPEETYNCRCCEFSHVKGYPIDIPKWSPKMGDMTFEEWLGEHEETPVSKAPSYLFGDMVSQFTPAKSIKEAEEYAQQFVSSYKSKYSGNVSFKGMDIEYANKANRVLTEVFARYKPDVLDDIIPMNKREKRWKDSTADAAYQWGGNGRLFFNSLFYKNEKALNDHMNESKSLLDKVLGGIDTLLGRSDLSESKRFYIEALKESGVQCIGQKTDDFAMSTFVHECGHMLDDKIFRGMMKDKGFDIGESMRSFAKGISGYSATSNSEYIAESFAAYWFGYGDKVDPKLIEIFKEAEHG